MSSPARPFHLSTRRRNVSARPLLLLPHALVVRVLEFLWVIDLGAAARVCRTWHLAAHTDHLWEALLPLYTHEQPEGGPRGERVTGRRAKMAIRDAIAAAASAHLLSSSTATATMSTAPAAVFSAAIERRGAPGFIPAPPPPPPAVTSTTGWGSSNDEGGGGGNELDGALRGAAFSSRVHQRPSATPFSGNGATVPRWVPPVLSVAEQLTAMEHELLASPGAITEAARVRLVEEQMAVLRQRLEAARLGAEACSTRLGTLAALARPLQAQAEAQLVATGELMARVTEARRERQRCEEFLLRRKFIADFEALVVRSVLRCAPTSSGRVPMLSTFAQLECYVLSANVFGTSTYMRWNLVKRGVPIGEAYYDAVDAILDAPLAPDGASDGQSGVVCDHEIGDEGGVGEEQHQQGPGSFSKGHRNAHWWFVPPLGGACAPIVATMKALLLLHEMQAQSTGGATNSGGSGGGGEKDFGVSYEDILHVASRAQGNA